MGGGLGSWVVEVRALDTDGGNSGAAIERVTLADGRVLIRKRVSPDGDWMARVAEDHGRLAAWWDDGVFDALPPTVDHGLVSVESTPDGGWDVYMRDVATALERPATPVSAADRARLLSAVRDLHATVLSGPEPPSCSLATRYSMFSARTMAGERRIGNPHGDVIGSGWLAFTDLVEPALATAVHAIGTDPTELAAELAGAPGAVVHGDLRLDNLGLTDDALVLIDWGERIGLAPPAVDVAWLLGFDGYRLGAPQDDVVDEILALYGDALDPRTMDLALLGAAVQLGGIIGLWVSRAATEEDRAIYAEHLDWLMTRAALALDRFPPLVP